MRARGMLDGVTEADVTEADLAEMRGHSTSVVEKVYRGMKAVERKTRTQLQLRQLMEVSSL